MSENYEKREGTFHVSQLTKVEPPKCPAVLGSGGPILDVLDIDEDGVALVTWNVYIDGVAEKRTDTFKTVCLYKCIPWE